MENAPEPIADDELLYRRVPKLWYARDSGIMSEAFAPHKLNDATGLSVARAKYKSVEDAAKGRAGNNTTSPRCELASCVNMVLKLCRDLSLTIQDTLSFQG